MRRCPRSKLSAASHVLLIFQPPFVVIPLRAAASQLVQPTDLLCLPSTQLLIRALQGQGQSLGHHWRTPVQMCCCADRFRRSLEAVIALFAHQQQRFSSALVQRGLPGCCNCQHVLVQLHHCTFQGIICPTSGVNLPQP